MRRISKKLIPLKIVLFFLLNVFSNPSNSQNLDFRILKSINHAYTPTGGIVFKTITNSINPISLGLPVELFIGGKVSKNKEMVWNSFEIASATAINGIFTTGLKLSVHRERPFITYPNDITKYSVAGSYSFPSGHTSMAFCTATSISFMYPKWYIIVPAYLWAGSVAYSRMYLGVHYPTDVLAGALLGTGTSIGTHYLFNYIKKKRTANDKVML
ncbi:MAG: putative undecaprenyl-diphosphatase ybjG [Bacteroidota bacterium]